MTMDESEKSSIAAEEKSRNSVSDGGGEGSAVEEGEEVDSSTRKLTRAMADTHPLENSWTFWFYKPSAKSKQAKWGSSIRPIYTFSTAEEFWSLYNNLPHPSKLTAGADFHCFKHKIEPKWEDPVCANGGKWNTIFNRAKSDVPWLHTLLAMIGEQFDHGDEICGAVVSVRHKQEKIALWTKNATNESAQLSIGQQWQKFLDYKEKIGFIFHEDAKNLNNAARSKYTV